MCMFILFKIDQWNRNPFLCIFEFQILLLLHNTTENSTNMKLQCTGNGEPKDVNILSRRHSVAGSIIRSTDDFPNISTDKRVITLHTVKYEDAGLYTCTGTNGIPDRNGVKEQSDSSYLDVTGKYITDKFTVTLGDLGLDNICEDHR